MAHEKWRKAVKTRDNGICAICGDVGTNAHHILCEGYYPELSNDVENGITLCRTCHVLVHRGKFGTIAKGKYPPDDAIDRLKKRAISIDKIPLIRKLIMADTEATQYALLQSNQTNEIMAKRTARQNRIN